MPERTPLDWADLERELHAAGVSPEEIEAGARRLLAQARGRQLAETRKQLGLGQKQIAAAMGVSVARVSQIEHGEVTSVEVIARYVEALGGRLDLVADFGDRAVRLPTMTGQLADLLSFRRIAGIPFDAYMAAFDSWQLTGPDGELRLGNSLLRGPIERDHHFGTCRIQVRLA